MSKILLFVFLLCFAIHAASERMSGEPGIETEHRISVANARCTRRERVGADTIYSRCSHSFTGKASTAAAFHSYGKRELSDLGGYVVAVKNTQ